LAALRAANQFLVFDSQSGAASLCIRRIHAIIRDKNEVQVKLTTGDELRGKLVWIDDQCICMDASGHKIVIWQHAIAFIKG